MILRALLAFVLLAAPAWADHYGDRAVGSTVIWTCATMGSTGPATLSGGTVACYRDASNVQTTTGCSIALDQDTTGRHVVTVDTSADGSFYTAGSTFEVIISAGTVSGTSFIGMSCGSFSLEATAALRPATAGRTLVVSSGGVADAQVKGLDADTVTASAIAPDAIGASELAAGAITSSEFAQTAADLVWGSASRTLTSFGTLTTDTATAVWANGTRSLTDKADFGLSSTALDSIWDEPLSGHLTAGSTGFALNAAGSAGDPWATELPGSYTGGEAGARLAAIQNQTDLINAGGVTVTTPYNPTTGKLTLTRGDDYAGGDLPAFTSEDWPDLTGATIRFTIRLRQANGTGGTLLLTMTDTEAERIEGAGEQSILFEPLSALGSPAANNQDGTTNDLIPGTNKALWDIQATLASGAVKTLATGLMDVVEDITRP